MQYSHLTQDERYQIQTHLKMNKTISFIAKKMRRNKGTISREIRRNSGGRGYRSKQANQKAVKRSSTSLKAIKMTANVIALIEEKILLNWSPEQISGYLSLKENISISHETIYQHVLRDKKSGGILYTHLRCQKKRRKRYGTKCHDRRGQIKDRVSIEKRPKIVDKKLRIGDWEGDLIIGRGQKMALVTLVDRKSKRLKMMKVTSKNSAEVSLAICKLLRSQKVRTITFDNGKEFSMHKEIAKKTNSKVYFAHPYSSWERGLNENTNGLIRQYFPKGSCFLGITALDVKRAEDAINSRPRKTLKYKTPDEINQKYK